MGDLGSVDTAAKGQNLGADLLVDGLVALNVEEGVPQVVAASNDLNLVHVVGVDGGHADTAVVHLAGEDLVTEEVVAPDAGVGVGEVVRVSHGHIGQVSEESVRRVVLFLDVVEMLSMLVNTVGSKNVLEKQECVVVLVLDGGGVVEDTDVRVVHLVITDEEQGWRVNSLVGVSLDASGGLGNVSEGLVDLVDKLLVADVAGTDDDEVITEVVGSLELTEVINVQVGEQVSVSLDWLAELMVTEGVVMAVFEGGVLHVLVGVLMVSSDFLLKDLELCRVKAWVSNSITEHRHGTVNIVLEDSHANAGLFTAGFAMETATKRHNLLVNLSTGVGLATTGQQVAENMGSTSSGWSIVTGTSTDVDTNGGSLVGGLLSADADAVSESCDLY